MKRFLVFSILVVAALAIAACAQTPAAPEEGAGPAEKITIGVANFSQCCAYFIGMNNAVISEAAYYPNVEILSTDADGDAAKFTADIEDLIAKGVDGVIISGAWLEQAPAALDSLKAAGIPAVLVDRQWSGEYTSYVGPENFTIGKQDGEYIVDRLGGEGTLVVIKGGPADNSIGLNRTNGMLSVVEQSPGIEIITAPDFAGWSEDGGLTQMENLLAANSKIDAVFCENDSMCLGAQRAIGDAGRTEEMFLVGVDGQKEALLQILNGTNYAATGLNNSDQIGRAGFNRMMSILAGAAAEHDTYLPSPLITQDNVEKYYDPNSLF